MQGDEIVREESESKRKGVKERDFALSPVPIVCKRGCPDRSWNCHASCERYKAYREACDIVLHEKELEREIINVACDRITKREKLNRR